MQLITTNIEDKFVNLECHHIDFFLKLVDITVFLDMKESVKTVQEVMLKLKFTSLVNMTNLVKKERQDVV
jgi:hypothetical protein